MGIYLFDKDTLKEILHNNKKTDFGKEVIPGSFSHKLTNAYIHNGYWKDIGTIKTFYEENLVFTDSIPPIDLFDEDWQFFTRARHLSPAKIEGCRLDRVMIGEGSMLNKCQIYHSVIGLRSRVGEGVDIRDSIIMGADFYQSLDDMKKDQDRGLPPIGIGKDSVIKKAIIDKNVRIGQGVKIINNKNVDFFESELYSIKDGIVIIPKNTVIASHTII